jgi:hypothetical protein
MDALQNTDIQNSREKYGRVTTVRLNKETRNFLVKQEMRLATMLNAAPVWYARMVELNNELNDLRTGIARKDQKLSDLWTENAELREFKAKTMERWKLTRPVNHNG